MKNRFTFTILLISLFIGACSNSEDSESVSNSIIGDWDLESQYSDDGTKEDIGPCEYGSTINFYEDGTFDLRRHRVVNGSCKETDRDIGAEYIVTGDLLEANRTTINSDGTTSTYKYYAKIKIEGNTLELSRANEDGSLDDFSKDIWIKLN